MKAKTITNAAYGEENKHLGGYIQKIWYNYEKGYLTIGMKSFDSYGTEYVNIMVFEKNGKTMIISRGIGNSVIPFRLFNRPEIVCVTLDVQ